MSLAYPAQLLCRCRLNIQSPHGDPQETRDPLTDPSKEGGQARPLGQQCDICINDPESPLNQHPEYPLREYLAGDALVAWVCVREMAPDVPLAHGAKKGIHQGMEKHIRIRMTCQSSTMWNLNPTKDELSSTLKPMDIQPVTYSKRIFQKPNFPERRPWCLRRITGTWLPFGNSVSSSLHTIRP